MFSVGKSAMFFFCFWNWFTCRLLKLVVSYSNSCGLQNFHSLSIIVNKFPYLWKWSIYVWIVWTLELQPFSSWFHTRTTLSWLKIGIDFSRHKNGFFCKIESKLITPKIINSRGHFMRIANWTTIKRDAKKKLDRKLFVYTQTDRRGINRKKES